MVLCTLKFSQKAIQTQNTRHKLISIGQKCSSLVLGLNLRLGFSNDKFSHEHMCNIYVLACTVCTLGTMCCSPERLFGDVLTGETEGVREEE